MCHTAVKPLEYIGSKTKKLLTGKQHLVPGGVEWPEWPPYGLWAVFGFKQAEPIGPMLDSLKTPSSFTGL